MIIIIIFSLISFLFQDDISDIKVHCLQTEEEAILDIDDLVADVCDDKDTVCLHVFFCLFCFIYLYVSHDIFYCMNRF